MFNKSFRQIANQMDERKENRKGIGKYTMVPHAVFRELLPELDAKYGGRDARDCVILYLFFFAMINNEKHKEYYGWAFPSFEQIVEKTGIHRSRITKLVRILEKEKLIIVKETKNGTYKKKFYCPVPFEGFDDDENPEE